MTTDVAGPAGEDGSVIQQTHPQRVPVILNKMHHGWIGGSFGNPHNEMLYSLMSVFPATLPGTTSRESLGFPSTFSTCRNKAIITSRASGELTEQRVMCIWAQTLGTHWHHGARSPSKVHEHGMDSLKRTDFGGTAWRMTTIVYFRYSTGREQRIPSACWSASPGFHIALLLTMLIVIEQIVRGIHLQHTVHPQARS